MDEEFLEEHLTGSHEKNSVEEEAARWMEAMHQTPLDDEAISKAIMDFCVQAKPAGSSEDSQRSNIKLISDQGRARAGKQEADQSSKMELEPKLKKAVICKPKEKAGSLIENSFGQYDLLQSTLLDQGRCSIKETVKGKQLIPQESVTITSGVKQVEDEKDKIGNALEEITRLSVMLEERQKGIFLTSEKGSQDLSLGLNQWRRPPKGPKSFFPDARHSDVCRKESVRTQSDKVPWIKELKESQRFLRMKSRLKLIKERVQLGRSNLDPDPGISSTKFQQTRLLEKRAKLCVQERSPWHTPYSRD